MIDTIAKQLGPGFLVPAIFLLVLGWGVKIFLDVHASSRQRRREFLEAWKTLDQEDDLSMEVAVRHLTGTLLPAQVIRAVLSLPTPAERLFQLSTTWDYLTFDGDTMTLRAKNPALHDPNRRRRWQAVFTAGYFTVAFTGLVLLRFGMAGRPTELLSWMLVFIAFACGTLALACLARVDKLGAFGRWSASQLKQITMAMSHRANDEAEAAPALPLREKARL